MHCKPDQNNLLTKEEQMNTVYDAISELRMKL